MRGKIPNEQGGAFGITRRGNVQNSRATTRHAQLQDGVAAQEVVSESMESVSPTEKPCGAHICRLHES